MITKFSKFKVKESKPKKEDLPEVLTMEEKKLKKLKAVKDINKDYTIQEAVSSEGKDFAVKAMYKVPKELIKEYIEKVKTEVGKNPLEFWGAQDMAEEVVKYILDQYLKIDNIPANLVFGDTKLEDEAEAEVEAEAGDDVEVTEETPAEPEQAEEDFTKDTVEEAPVEEEEMFGMSEGFTDNDIKVLE